MKESYTVNEPKLDLNITQLNELANLVGFDPRTIHVAKTQLLNKMHPLEMFC